CRERGIRLNSNYEEILSDRSIDAVVLATPNSQHETQIKQAAVTGKHIYVEKPFTLTLASARAAVDVVTRARVKLAVGLNRRFHPNMLELTQRVRSGALGTLSAMNAELTAATGFHRPTTSWRVRAEEEPAGAMVSIGVHLVDAMINMAGKVREVYCVAANRGGPHGHDTTHLMLQFECGITGFIYCSVAATRNHRMAVYGTKGFAEVLKPQMDIFRFIPIVEGHSSHLARIPEPEVIESPGFNYVGKSLTEFARCIRENEPYPISISDILHGAAVLEAAVHSAATKKPVQVTD
ncbi:MAG TPA: Gfo/Idh/MocA family oxidoreductase, partial [Burkholderiales bacterium]|nr:Gfo/Idh/MocA family oxidoreductase [Burkholderiales bacterium]